MIDPTGTPLIPPVRQYRVGLRTFNFTLMAGVLRPSKDQQSAMRAAGVRLRIGSRSAFVRVPYGPVYAVGARYTPEYLQDAHAAGQEVPIPPGAVWGVDPEDFTFRLYERPRSPTLRERLRAVGAGFLKV